MRYQQTKLYKVLPNYIGLSLKLCLHGEAGVEQHPKKFSIGFNLSAGLRGLSGTWLSPELAWKTEVFLFCKNC